MGTVNLLNNSWLTSSNGSMTVNATNTNVEFSISSSSSDWTQNAKACIAIDASKYKTISFNYSKVSHSGTTSLCFGVFDDSSYSNDSGSIVISDGIGNWDRDNGGSCTLDISDLTGTKYVGFWFYGNAEGAKARDNIYITKLTATEAGYQLSYNANGGSGAPDSVSDITSATISSRVPTRDGYDFLGWSTSSYATYADYVAGDTISLSANTILYAVWLKLYTITYNANGGSGATSSQTVSPGSSVALRSNSFTAPTSKIWTLTLDGNGGNGGSPTFKGNYFNKWRAGSTSGTAYSEGDYYTPSQDTTMYAWWGTKYIFGTTTRDPDYGEGYTVTFDSNGGTCDIGFLTSEIVITYDFLGWGNSADNPTSTFKSDVTFTQTSDYTAYAIWSQTIINGSISLPTPTRNGYEFLGWSTDAYDIDSIISECAPTEDMVLYAIWKPTGLVFIYDGEFSPYQVLIHDNSGWNQYIPYIYTESGWEIYSG